MKSDITPDHPPEETTATSHGLWPQEWKTLKVLTRELSVRSRIADIFLTEPADRMYAEVLQAVLEALKSRRGIFCRCDEGGSPVCLSCTGTGVSDARAMQGGHGFRREDWADLWRRAFDDKRTLCSNAPVQSPQGDLLASRVLVAPIVFRDASIGLFAVADKDTDYDEMDALVMEAITQHVSPILKARLDRDREEARRIEAEASMRRSHAFLDTVIESMPDPLLVVDPLEHSVVMANSAARVLARGDERICHALVFDCDTTCPEQDRACMLGQAMQSGKPQLVERERILDDGRRQILEMSARPMLAEDGSRVLVILSVRDITDRKREEEERYFVQKKVFEAEKVESLAVLSGRIAHDFNNLLVGVIGNVDMALPEITPDSALASYVRQIRVAADRLVGLAGQLLRYSGKGGSAFLPVNLSRLLDTLNRNGLLSVSKGTVVRMDLDASLPPIRAVETQIGLAVRNLVTNAAEAMGGGGVISLRTGVVRVDRRLISELLFGEKVREGDHVFLDVSDTGVGIAPADVRRLFDPFFTTKPSGPGLGLAAVFGIVSGHGGGIHVESEPRRGTTFRLLFPCLGAPAPLAEVPEARHRAGEETRHAAVPRVERAPTLPEIPPAYDRAGETTGWVLVVEDEETVRMVAQLMLEHAGFRVLSAGNGLEALDLLHYDMGNIACVLLDLTMPVMDGIETFQRIRSMRPDIPVVLTTGYCEGSLMQDFEGKGLSGFLQKPYNADALVSMVRDTIGKR